MCVRGREQGAGVQEAAVMSFQHPVLEKGTVPGEQTMSAAGTMCMLDVAFPIPPGLS